ncbi:acyltransferase [Pedobacter frigiditerrae]|uniref:acyltransferase family protein n=1 Tax=Pedobacter frigiditerrae TaxID=2530452 RepID=UPI00293140B9|nr:acyltransferase [Pedobacter frigiditerrae]
MIKKEIKSLTGIRGIAAIYVAVFHFYLHYTQSNSNNFLSKNSYLHSLLYHGYLGVDLFFILSAFVITLTSSKYFEDKFEFKDYKNFMIKRWIRIYPTYAIILIVTFFYSGQTHRVGNFLLSFSLLNSLFGLPYLVGHFWSLSTEWVTYMTYPILYRLFSAARLLKWQLLILIGILILYSTCVLYYKEYAIQPFSFVINGGYYGLFRCFGDYFLGVFAFKIFSHYPKSKEIAGITSIVIIFILICLLSFAKADLLIVILFVALILSLTNDNNVVSKLMSTKPIYILGLISYPLYLIHAILLYYLDYLKTLLSIFYGYNNFYLILMLLFLALSVIFSYIFTFFIEKPIISFCNKKIHRVG